MMSLNASRVISALVAGIMVIALLAACGEIEKAKQDTDPSLPVSSSEPEPEATERPTIEQISNEPDESEMPAQAAEPVQEQEAESYETDYTELYARRAQTIVDSAIVQLGTPYSIGGDSPEEGFDSTGFTYYCVRQADIKFPRQLEDQLEFGEKIGYDQMAAGDIVYFSADVGGEATFCGVYVGGGMIIYSPTPDDFVKTANITTNYWVTHFVTGLRVTHAEN